MFIANYEDKINASADLAEIDNPNTQGPSQKRIFHHNYQSLNNTVGHS